jgi:hypothetical protein
MKMQTRVCWIIAILAVAAAQEQILYGPIVAQVPLASCDIQILCNDEACADICVEGSVVVDPWYQTTLGFQRSLQYNRSLSAMQWLGTHNGFISRANGMGLTEDLGQAMFPRVFSSINSTLRVADQRYAAIDLLNMGVRHLEVDIWSLDVVSGKAHICHSPVMDPLYGIALQDAADLLGLGDLQYQGGDELCSNITFASALERVMNWLSLPQNSQEIVGLFLDNRVPDYNIQTVVDDITNVLGSMLITPGYIANTYGGVWPSAQQLVKLNKRVFVETNCYNPNNYTGTNITTVAFYPTLWDAYQDDPDTVEPFPNCTIQNDPTWYGNSWVRILEGTVVWFPDYDERSSGGVFDRQAGIADMMNCGVGNIAISNFGPDVLPGLVWTWAAGEPKPINASCRAAAMTTVRGRWTAQDCNNVWPAMCRKGSPSIPAGNNPNAFQVTSPVNFHNAAAACASLGAGWTFDVPRDGRENTLIATNATLTSLWRTQKGIWMNVQQ